MTDRSRELEILELLRQEGHISPEDHETLTRTIEASVSGLGTDPVGPRSPGWHNDPSGVYPHQAYWDGTRWTGLTRPTPSPGRPKKRAGRIAMWSVVGLGAALLIALIYMAAVLAVRLEETPCRLSGFDCSRVEMQMSPSPLSIGLTG